MITDLISDIAKITVFLLLFLAIFLFTVKGKNRRSNVLFALFLIVTSFDMSALFLGGFYTENLSANDFRVASVFLQMPLFYFYVKTICYYNFKLHWQSLWHSLPFLVFIALFSTVGMTDQNFYWYGIATQLQYYAYIVAVLFTLHRYKTLKLQNHSLRDETYTWLMTTTLLFLSGNCLVLFRTVSESYFDLVNLNILNLLVSLFGLFVICWFVLKTMRTPGLFRGIHQKIKPLKKEVLEDKTEYQEEIQQLSEFMSSIKPYLEDTLTLQKLAEQIGIPEKQLSFLINRVIGKHFFDYVNGYRIEEAKTLLKDKERNIQQVMYDVGFNSKSSFNTAFKKDTSLTPSAYRAANP
ncbi:MAG: AraC family transcriptional regulator [Bacteroidota bacterium]